MKPTIHSRVAGLSLFRFTPSYRKETVHDLRPRRGRRCADRVARDGLAKEFRLRRALQDLLARLFHHWRDAHETGHSNRPLSSPVRDWHNRPQLLLRDRIAALRDNSSTISNRWLALVH